MSASRQDVFRLMGFVQDDLRRVQARLVEVRSMLASMPVVESEHRSFWCATCVHSFRSEREFAFHRQNVHGGPAVALSEAEEAA